MEQVWYDFVSLVLQYLPWVTGSGGTVVGLLVPWARRRFEAYRVWRRMPSRTTLLANEVAALRQEMAQMPQKVRSQIGL